MNGKTLSGSCLCGAVRYTAKGHIERFYHCHCKRCRKATGTGHASNLFLKGRLTWDRGEEHVGFFKLPEAARFSNTFCRQCGARLPKAVPELNAVMIPAGSLDDDPGCKPEARIFLGSRAEWSCGNETLPGFEEYAG